MTVKFISKVAPAVLLFLALCGCHKDQANGTPDVSSELAGCAGSLSRIAIAKAAWARNSGAASNSTPTMDDLSHYFRNPPACPAGGTYIIGAMNELPKCSIASHNDYFLSLEKKQQEKQQEEQQQPEQKQ